MKKRIYSAFAALAVLFMLSGCAGQPSAASSQDKIVIYTSMYENVIASIKEELEKRFPSSDIEFVYGGTVQLQARIAYEESSGRLGCDMLLVADPSYAIELKEKGMLHSYVSPSASGLAFDYDTEGYWYPVRVSNMVLAYNPSLNTKDSVPNSFYDFVNNPAVRGEVSMGSPHTSGTVLASLCALGEKYGDSYIAAFGAQRINIDTSGAALKKLESGEYKEIMILEESALQKRRENPSALEIIYPLDGTVMIPSPVMTIAEGWSANRNTKTAEKITEWFLGPDGQNAIVDGFMHPVTENFPRLPEGSIPTSEIRAGSMPVNWENSLSYRNEVSYKFDEALAARNLE